MSTERILIHGSTAQRMSVTPALGQIGSDDDTGRVVVGDGVTAGGIEMARLDEVGGGGADTLEEVIKTDTYSVTADDAGLMLVANKATAMDFDLPAVGDSDSEVYNVRNIGAGDLTVDPNSTEQIEGASTLVLKTGESARVWPNEGKTAWRATVWGRELRKDQNLADLPDPATARTNLGILLNGQCELVLDGGSLKLLRRNGQFVWCDGTLCTVPATPLTLAATSLTPGTLYYIYATESGGTLNALEASTTAPTQHTDGTMVMTGATSKVLVGAASPVTGPAWVDSASQRHVRSWFNDRGVVGNTTFTTTRTRGSSSYGEVHSEIRISAILWAGERVRVESVGSPYPTSTSGFYIYALVTNLAGTVTGYPAGGTVSYGAFTGTYTNDGAHVAEFVQASTALETFTIHGKATGGNNASWDAFSSLLLASRGMR